MNNQAPVLLRESGGVLASGCTQTARARCLQPGADACCCIIDICAHVPAAAVHACAHAPAMVIMCGMLGGWSLIGLRGPVQVRRCVHVAAGQRYALC